METNKPIRKYKIKGGVIISVWDNDGFRTVTLQKRYKDKKTEEWANSKSFLVDDIPKLTIGLLKLYKDEGIKVEDREEE